MQTDLRKSNLALIIEMSRGVSAFNIVWSKLNDATRSGFSVFQAGFPIHLGLIF